MLAKIFESKLELGWNWKKSEVKPEYYFTNPQVIELDDKFNKWDSIIK